MNDKKIRLAIAVGVALLVHILASLFFLCLNAPSKVLNAENITEIEVYNLTNQTPTKENYSDLPAATTSTAATSNTDRRELNPSSQPQSTAPTAVADTQATGSEGSGDNRSQQSTTAATGGRPGVPVVMPRVLSAVQPVYPLQAKNSGIQGRVYLRILVNTQGSVEQVSIATSSGNASLDDAATQAAMDWTFSPAKDESGQTVNCYIRMPIDFNLKNR